MSLISFIPGCSHGMGRGEPNCPPAPEPLDIRVYQGMSDMEAIVRSQDDEAIACSDPAFNEFFAVSHEDFSNVLSTLKYCYDSLD